MDTFVPNDAHMIGGAGVGAVVESEYDDDPSESELGCLRNSMIVCTGANACGKVGSSLFHACSGELTSLRAST